jgi:uncharacterized protein (TIGR04255 family)
MRLPVAITPCPIVEHLTLAITIEDRPLSGSETYLKTVIPGLRCNLLLQISKDVTLVGQEVIGSTIDIDAFEIPPPVSTDLDSSINDFLEAADSEEKRLFFSLLKSDFVATLNPAY